MTGLGQHCGYTFTENYWDLKGLSFYFGARNVLGGARFGVAAFTFDQQMTQQYKWKCKKLSSLQLLLQKGKKGNKALH